MDRREVFAPAPRGGAPAAVGAGASALARAQEQNPSTNERKTKRDGAQRATFPHHYLRRVNIPV